jgi:AcrR family transcriptional regulator
MTLCQWLQATAWSTALHESVWVYPIIESVHVLGLCLFVGLTLVMDLRLLQLVLRRAPQPDVLDRLLPWIRAGFAVMVASGVLLFYASPVRFYGNIFFRLKTVLLVLAGLNAWLFHQRADRAAARAGGALEVPAGSRFAGATSLLLWAAIITSGRLIAYNWFDK